MLYIPNQTIRSELIQNSDDLFGKRKMRKPKFWGAEKFLPGRKNGIENDQMKAGGRLVLESIE